MNFAGGWTIDPEERAARAVREEREADARASRPKQCRTCHERFLSGAHMWDSGDPTYRCPECGI